MRAKERPTAGALRWQRAQSDGRGRRQEQQIDGRRASPTRIITRVGPLLDNIVLLAHDLAALAAYTELASDARAATDAAQAAYLLWRIVEHYATESEVAA